ncbi:hypothetical protein [Serinicoccus sp. CUA-874]|uniref:hypothetical protein n=1 Tax=Serinicoccus sp. CUA-874 TaxID=1517939 RepID=UPI00130141B3|nr:hypothetical protein [Serinicoccus sp. CUA-874]
MRYDVLDEAIDAQISDHQDRGDDVDLPGSLRRAGCPQFADVVLERRRLMALRRA